jgi:predicted PurR-regulated permease PerM
MFGPVIAGLIAFLVALFQGSNWWGLAPLTFALVVLAVFALIQQVENNILVPRIIGRSLNLRPLVVLLAALAGASLAGVLGLLLAAPAVASLRIWLGYVYRKTLGLDTWPGSSLGPPRPARPRLASRLIRRFRAWRSRRGPPGPESGI